VSWRSIRRRLERLENSVVTVDPNETPQQRFVRLYGFESFFRPATEEARAALKELLLQHELDHDPPDSIDRLLARKMAELSGEPDPYGSDGMSGAERRAHDWADYLKKQCQREEGEQPADRPQYGLRELQTPDTIILGSREREREQVA
jgi:hypothetical protein